MATVLRCWDSSLGREVAIKVPRLSAVQDNPEDEAFWTQFIDEGRTMALLDHPNIVTVFAAGIYDGQPAVIMELVRGVTLRTLLRNSRLDNTQAFAIMGQVLEAIAYTHSRRVIHLDLKPENVFLRDDGRVKVGDFGIARAGGTVHLGPTLDVVGTFGYMSPEQLEGRSTGRSSDVFSLGVLAYELVSGTNPFAPSSNTMLGTITHRILNVDPEPLTADSDELTGLLGQVITRALRKSPTDRYPSAVEMLEEWQAVCPSKTDDAAQLATSLSEILRPEHPVTEQQPAGTSVGPATEPGVPINGHRSTGSTAPEHLMVADAAAIESEPTVLAPAPIPSMPPAQTNPSASASEPSLAAPPPAPPAFPTVPPAIPEPQSPQHVDGVWRHGKKLVMTRQATLPDRCIRTNQPANGNRLTCKLAWHEPAFYLLLLPGILPYVVFALIFRKKATIEVGFTEAFTRALRIAVIGSRTLFLLGFVLLAFTDQVIIGLLAMVVAIVWGVVWTRTVTAVRIEDNYIWLKGVHRDYLAALPLWTPPPTK